MFRLDAQRKLLMYWGAWFYLSHVLFFWLIGLNYFFAEPAISLFNLLDDFILVGFMGHLAVLALFSCVWIVPMVFLFPHKRAIFTVVIITASLASSLLIMDTVVYRLYHYHFNHAVLMLAFYGVTEDSLGLSFLEKMAPILIIFTFVVIELFYANWLWNRVKHKTTFSGWFKYIIAIFALLVYASYVVVVINMNPIWLRSYIEKTRFLPFYAHTLAILMPKHKESLALIRIDHEDPLEFLAMDVPLQYPKHPLYYHTKHSPLNLVIIGIDTWRFDMLNKEVTPAIFDFSKKSWVFYHHMSGGNSTGPGIFSLFYGIPANYMTAMEDQDHGPVLIDVLKKHRYQIGVFSSAPLYVPPLNQSVFLDVEHLSNEGSPADTVFLRDQRVVERFKDFIQHRETQRPFFNFLFFDAAHSYCGIDEVSGPFQPTVEHCNRLAFDKKRDYQRYLNRYKNAVLFVDEQVHKTIEILKASDLLKNTVIIIVGDHGEEFDDNNQGYYGHASNFDRYQVQTPLIVYWPGEKPAKFYHTTSHFDIVPTLMTKLFGCENKLSDYTVGYGLLSTRPRPYFVISSYVDFGVVELDRITTVYSAGNYHIEKPNGTESEEAINLGVMRNVFNELRYFYRSS